MRRIAFISLIVFIQSCVFIRIDDSIDLGKNYRYIQDYPQGIIYQVSKEHIGSGPYAIPSVILKYAYDENWIIAINKDLEDEKIRYWIVDKNADYKDISPMDSIVFYENTQKMKIELKMEKDFYYTTKEWKSKKNNLD